MEKEFVPQKQALSLNELGFDELCFMIYYDGTNELRGSSHFLYSRDIKAPLYQQAFRWFREKYKISAIISQFGYAIENEYGQIIYTITDDINPLNYEEAELACLDKLIEIVKNETNR